MTSSRGTHVTRDIIPADSRQILMVLTAKNVRPLPCMQFCFFCPTAACLCCPVITPAFTPRNAPCTPGLHRMDVADVLQLQRRQHGGDPRALDRCQGTSAWWRGLLSSLMDGILFAPPPSSSPNPDPLTHPAGIHACLSFCFWFLGSSRGCPYPRLSECCAPFPVRLV